MKDLYIIGAGGCGREVLQWIKDSSIEYNIIGFLDDNLKALDDFKCSHKIISKISEYIPKANDVFVCAIANPDIKEKIMTSYMVKGAHFINIVHPTSVIAETAELGTGIVVYPYCVISDNTVIGDFVTLNLYDSIGHDAEIGDYTTISAHCDITGAVKIGKKVFMGTHVSIVPRVKIKDEAVLCAGSVVMNNISRGKKVLGNPAKKFEI